MDFTCDRICVDTKWLTVLSRSSIIRSGDQNIPHYGYTSVGCLPSSGDADMPKVKPILD